MTTRLFRALVIASALGLAGSTSVLAQDRPAIFLHGFHAVGADWADTAARLRATLAIDPRTPDLPWRQTYEQQAQSLAGLASSLPLSPVLVGHSNGGVVAREFAKAGHVNGIATIGTPHGGAPIVPAFGQWLAFQAAAPSFLNEVLQAFATPSNLTWTYSYIQSGLGWTSDFSIWSVVYLASVLGLDASMPVAAEMAPGSAYLSGLNSSANLQHEAATVPGRVGVVSIAHEYYWAGPARAIYPAGADDVAAVLYGTAYGLIYWGGYIMSDSDPTDTNAFRQAVALTNLGEYLLSIDPTYCRLVSGAFTGECLPNDGIVPYTSQQFPGAANIFLGLDDDGPAHSQERDWGESVLADALASYLHVPLRSSGSTPPPNGPGTDPGPPAPPSGHAPPPRGSDPGLMFADDRLGPNQSITSGDGRFHFIYQSDGNLVLYDEHWVPLWASRTAGTNPGMALMQADGNFVIYDVNTVPLWSSGTPNHSGAFLFVQDDGNVVVYDANSQPLWATGTCCR